MCLKMRVVGIFECLFRVMFYFFYGVDRPVSFRSGGGGGQDVRKAYTNCLFIKSPSVYLFLYGQNMDARCRFSLTFPVGLFA